MIGPGKPILLGQDKKVVEDVLNCPLKLLSYTGLVHDIKERLQHSVGLHYVLKALEKDPSTFVNPFTNLPVMGLISLAAEKSHVKQANAMIAKLFTGGKKTGNVDLFYAVLYKLISHSKFEHIKTVADHAARQMQFRCMESRSYVGLSGLSNYDCTMVPLLVALWYSVASARLQIPARNMAARNHIFYASMILELLELNGVKVSPAVMKELDKIRCLHKILTYAKKKCYYLDLLTKALLFKGNKFTKEGRKKMALQEWRKYVAYFVEDPPKPTTIEKVQQLYKVEHLTLQEIFAITLKADPNKKSKDVSLSGLTAEIDQRYNYWDHDPHVDEPVPICPATMRPYFRVGKLVWRECVENIYNKVFEDIVDISYHKLFGAFVCKYGKYPEQEEFIAFLQCKYERKKVVLPRQVSQAVKTVFEDFDKVTEGVSAARFKRLYLSSLPIPARL